MVETETPSETTSKYLPTTPTPADPYFFLYSLGPEQVTTFLKTMEYYPTLKSPSPNKGAHLDICLGRCFCSFLVNDAEGLEIVRKLNLELGGLRPGYRGSLGDGWTHFYVSPLQVIQTENGMATSDFKTIVLVKEISEAKSDDLARRKTLAEEIRTKLEGVATGNNPAPKVPISVATTGGYYDVCLVFGAGHDDAAKYIQAIRDTRRFQTYTIPAISWKSIFPKGGTDSEREERTALVNLEITVRPGYMHEAIQHLKIDLGECDVHPSAEFRVMPGHKDAICGPHRVRIIPFVRRLLNRYGKSDTYFLATRTLPIIEWQGIQVPLSGDGNKDSDTVASAVQIKAQPISPWDIPTVVGGYDWTPRYKWTLERNGCYQGFHRATADAFGAAASRDSWSGPDRADIVPRLIHGCAPPYTGRPVGGNAPGDSKFPMLRDIFISHGVLLLDDPEPVIEHELFVARVDTVLSPVFSGVQDTSDQGTGKKKFALSDVQSREFRKSIAELSATAVTLSQLNGTVKEVVKRWLSAYAAIDPDGEGARFKDPTEPDYYGRLIGGWFLRNLLASVGKKPAPTDEFTPSLGWLRPLYQAVKDVCEVLADDDPRFQKLDLFSQTGFLDFARTLLIPGHDEVIRSVEADQKRRMAMCRLARDSWNLVLWYAHAAVSDRGICSNSADPSADLLEGELVIGLTSADAGILADLYAIAAADTNHVDIRGLCRRIGNEISAEDREEAS